MSEYIFFVSSKLKDAILLVGMKIVTATVENKTEIPLKTKNKITILLRNPTTRHTGNKTEKTHVTLIITVVPFIPAI